MTSALPRFDFQPVIIIGAARSGTNMLRDLLVELPGVATWPCDEINYLWRHGNAGHPTDQFPAELATPAVCRYLHRAFRKQALRTGAKTLVEKTCANSLRVDFVRQVFPDAKFVFIVRDGRDVVASALQRWTAKLDIPYLARKARFVPPSDFLFYATRYFGNRLHRLTSRESRLKAWGPRFDGMTEMLNKQSLVEVCAEQWRQSVLLAAESLAISPAQVCHVRYDAFVKDPANEFCRIAEFVAPQATDEACRIAAAQVRCTSVGKWKSAEHAREIAALEPLVDDVFQQLAKWQTSLHQDAA